MAEEKKGFFSRLVAGLTKTRNAVVNGLDDIFNGPGDVDDDFYEELEETLITGDIGVRATDAILEDLRAKVKEQHIKQRSECRRVLIDTIKEQMDLGENAYDFEHRKSVLLLVGVNGVGKTTMMLAVKRMLYLLTNEVMTVADAREIAALGKNSPTEFNGLKRCKLLGIDDLGTEAIIVKSYGNEFSPLAELIAARYSSRLFTVITTNLSVVADSQGMEVDELQKTYGDRIFDRLREMCNTIRYDGEQPSYRV